MVKICKCGKELKGKQKKYCSTECQYEGYRVKKTPRIEASCLLCGTKIETTEYKLSNGKSRYCSKSCNNEHKKITYKGENNGMWGKKLTKKHKKILSETNKEIWLKTNKREKMKKYALEYEEKYGYHIGCSPEALSKKKATNLKNWGVEHVGWNINSIREKIESTCLKKYNKHSWQLGHENQKNKDTDIEIIVESILSKNKIKYTKQHIIYHNKTKFKKYDFYLPQYNLLLECDGDYWHGNKNKIKEITENHLKVMENDKFKDNLALKNGFNLKRFWGSEIKSPKFEDVIMSYINKIL